MEPVARRRRPRPAEPVDVDHHVRDLEAGSEIRTQEILAKAGELPPWLGDPALHRSHQPSLLRKDPEFYRPLFGPDVPDDLPYVWPPSDRPARGD